MSPLPVTVHGSPDFNEWMQRVLDELGADVRDQLGPDLVALVLGGGYGRGEGGVDYRHGKELPYNDLDLVLVVHRHHRSLLDRLEPLRRSYETRLGIEVDFGRLLTPRDVRRLPHRLMWFDLLHGHRVLAGDPEILSRHAPASLNEPLPLVEASRLLLNRGSGMLWAMRIQRGLERAPDPDFLRRNYHKCALALGDSLMIAHKIYETPYRGREARLRKVLASEESLARLGIQGLYREALRFRFRPDQVGRRPPDPEMMQRMCALWGEVFLRIERQRMARPWLDLDSYLSWDGVREPEEWGLTRWPRNLVHNFRLGRFSLLYPRERLYRALPRLLKVTRPSPEADWDLESSVYLETWRRFN